MSLLLDLPPAVSTGRILPFVKSCDLLSFRVGCTGCYRLVHGSGRGGGGGRAATASGAAAASGDAKDSPSVDDNVHDDIQAARVSGVHGSNAGDDGETECENLWRQMLARDFGFCHNWDVRCGDEDGTLKGEMHLRTFRDPDEADGGRNTRCWAGKACRSGIVDATTADKKECGDGSGNTDICEQQQQLPRMLMRCSRCQTARYCDRACQVAHHRHHKLDCKKWSSSDLPCGFVGGSFLCTNEEMVASDAFESWKRWERLRLRFDKEARRADIRLGGLPDNSEARTPKADETFHIIGPFFLRCAEMWRTIEKWCNNTRLSGQVGHNVLKSLDPGRALPLTKSTLWYDPDEWAVQSPHLRGQPLGLESLMAVYAFYAGQDHAQSDDADSVFAGLLGSYSAYDFFASTRLRVPFCDDGERCMVAQSRTLIDTRFSSSGKTFSLDLTMGTMNAPHVQGEDERIRLVRNGGSVLGHHPGTIERFYDCVAE